MRDRCREAHPVVQSRAGNDLGSEGAGPEQAVSETIGIERQPVVNRMRLAAAAAQTNGDPSRIARSPRRRGDRDAGGIWTSQTPPALVGPGAARLSVRGPPVPHRNRKMLHVLRGRVLALRAAGRTTPLSAGFSHCGGSPPALGREQGFRRGARCALPRLTPRPFWAPATGRSPGRDRRKRRNAKWHFLKSSP